MTDSKKDMKCLEVAISVCNNEKNRKGDFIMASDDSDAMFYIENGYSSEAPWWVDDYYYEDEYKTSTRKKKAVVFVDAENISSKEFETKYKKKIKKFAKNRGMVFEDIEIRAYAVDGGPTSDSWESDGVDMKKIPGNPAKNKSDNQIAKELNDQAGKDRVCMLVTHDKKLQSKVNKALDGVYIFDE